MNEKEIRKLIAETIRQTVPLVLAQRQPPRPSGYKATEQRLYAYPVLVDNVRNRWPADIEDLKREPVGETSKSIVKWSVQGGVRITPEERQESRILAVQAKLEHDRQELAVMDRALATIKMDAAYPWLEEFYFQRMDIEAIAEKHETTWQVVAKGKAALVRVLALRLYGAEALE
jgi:hypothetical protein